MVTGSLVASDDNSVAFGSGGEPHEAGACLSWGGERRRWSRQMGIRPIFWCNGENFPL